METLSDLRVKELGRPRAMLVRMKYAREWNFKPRYNVIDVPSVKAKVRTYETINVNDSCIES